MNPIPVHPDHISISSLIMPLLGILVSVLLTTLIVQIRGLTTKHDRTAATLTSHMIEMAKLMALKVGFVECGALQSKCAERMERTMVKPISDGLVEQERDTEILWHALRGHRHTKIADRDDEVIIPQRPAAAGGGR